MLSLVLRTKPEAELLQAAQASCGHSLPGRWYPCPSKAMGMDSRIENVEGLP
jgi:hypothetical protein